MSFNLLTKGRKIPHVALAMSVLFFTQCQQPSKVVYGPDTYHVNESKTIKISIDPAEAKLKETLSSYVDSVQYLPLETTPESMFSDIAQLEVTDDKYIIWDRASNAILFFDKNGKYLTKISEKDKKLKKPYEKINHFAIDKKKNELMFNDQYTDQVYYYDLNGNFLRTERKPIYIEPAFTILDGGNKVYFQGYNHANLTSVNKPVCNIYITGLADEYKDKFYMPYDTSAVDYYDIMGTTQYFFNNHKGIVNFTRPYDYSIYNIDTLGQISKAFTIEMPDAYSVPQDFMENSRYRGKRIKYTDANDEVIYGVTDVYRSGNNIIFRLYGHGYDQMFTYNLKSKNLRSLSSYVSDRIAFLLPPFHDNVYAMDENGRIISSVSASRLFKSSLFTDPQWKNGLPERLKKFYNGDVNQNPVLTIAALKPNI